MKDKVKFKRVKRDADGFIIKRPDGTLIPATFIIRKSKGNFTNHNKVWGKLFDYYCNGYTNYHDFTKEEKGDFIRNWVGKGYRIVAVDFKECKEGWYSKLKRKIKVFCKLWR